MIISIFNDNQHFRQWRHGVRQAWIIPLASPPFRRGLLEPRALAARLAQMGVVQQLVAGCGLGPGHLVESRRVHTRRHHRERIS
jgi:hypothetical protein